MPYAILADLTLLLHLAFILFVAGGAFFVVRQPALLWPHVTAVCWGVWIELTGDICPLTPLENHYRALAGETGYTGDFIGHYLLPLIYPEGLTRSVQVAIGILVLLLNLGVYAGHFWRRHRR